MQIANGVTFRTGSNLEAILFTNHRLSPGWNLTTFLFRTSEDFQAIIRLIFPPSTEILINFRIRIELNPLLSRTVIASGTFLNQDFYHIVLIEDFDLRIRN